ncbi:hypothetical protein P4R16_003195 [Klebsiella oxytoca]|nr:hypothetical protein [Klebsiella oxytoca]
MTLLEILLRELPKRGGWPDKYNVAHTDGGLFKIVFAGPNLLNFAAPWSEGVDISNGDTLITREQYEAALAAVETEWNGEGLPPVGCECELSNSVEFYTHSGSTDFDEGTHVVVGGAVNFGLGDFVAVKIKGTNCITDINPCFLRPIRSEADRKRDEILSSLEVHLVQAYADNSGKTTERYLYDAIEAGKIPHLKIL